MARIEGVNEANAPAEVQAVFERQKKNLGQINNSTRVTALRPSILAGVQALAEGIRASGLLEPSLMQLATYRTALINGCPFWIDINAFGGTQRGIDDAKIAQVETFRTSEAFTPRERLALELAEAMTYTRRRVTTRLFKRLQKEFSDEELVELAAAIALENYRSKFNPVFGVEANGFCSIPHVQGAVRAARSRLG